METRPFRVVVIHNDPPRTATTATMGLDTDPTVGDLLEVPGGETAAVLYVIPAEGDLAGVVLARQT